MTPPGHSTFPFDGSVPQIPLLTGGGSPCQGSFFVADTECSDSVGVSGRRASLIEVSASAVPLPGALPLFGSSVIALAGLAAWRSKKVSHITR